MSPQFTFTCEFKSFLCSLMSLNLRHYNPRNHHSDLIRKFNGQSLANHDLGSSTFQRYMRRSTSRHFLLTQTQKGASSNVLQLIINMRAFVATPTLYHKHRAKSSMDGMARPHCGIWQTGGIIWEPKSSPYSFPPFWAAVQLH
jgi:hypothetical protein